MTKVGEMYPQTRLVKIDHGVVIDVETGEVYRLGIDTDATGIKITMPHRPSPDACERTWYRWARNCRELYLEAQYSKG